MTPGPDLSRKKTWLAVTLSIVPGLSLLYLGRWKKAAGILVVDAGIALIFIFSDSYLMKLVGLNIYFFTFIAPFIESYQLARYGRNTFDSDTRWYVVVLLLTTGFNALPLLWQSGAFSKRAKIFWSTAVPLLALIYVLALVRYWDTFESLLRRVLGAA